MSKNFILSCGSTADLAFDYVSGRDIPVIFYSYTVEGREYTDDMGRNPDALPDFYRMIADGKTPATSQINQYQYEEFFEAQLQRGDLLHIAFDSGLSNSARNAKAAAEALRGKYPDRKIIVIDSLCGSFGYGLIVDTAADMRDEGKTIDETAKAIMSMRKHVHHQFFSTELKYFRRSGRVSGANAAIATILGICPIMHLDNSGHIIAYDKARGKVNAIKKTVEAMEEHAVGGTDYSGKCLIGHSECLETAEQLRDAIEQYFPNLNGKVSVNNFGNIIASHCGPGTVAVFFVGDERE